MTAVHVGDEARLLIPTDQSEHHEPGMQKTDMIGILEVLLHQLPVAGYALARVAENRKLAAVEDAIEGGQNFRAEIALQRLDVMIERCKDHTVTHGNLELVEGMIRRLEVGGH